ncbi:MAG: hypothetical protein M1840_002536 [Geoglossum simile]|nr:MAG: hypothetical protein M1840_002536 [Geoglossum simile]
MRIILAFITLLVACSPFITALTDPQPKSSSRRVAPAQQDPVVAEPWFDEALALGGELEKRRGGGGGSKGGGSSGSKGGSKGGSGSKTGGKNSAASSKTFGGGRFFGGGAVTPFASGKRSPSGITPFLLPIAALSIFPGLWLFSAFAYPFPQPIRFLNATAANATFPDGVNQTLPALCLCQDHSGCGCDGNPDQAYIKSILGSGNRATLNKTLVQVSNVNGTETLVLNGTLNKNLVDGTSRTAGEHIVWWLLGGVVAWTVWMM